MFVPLFHAPGDDVPDRTSEADSAVRNVTINVRRVCVVSRRPAASSFLDSTILTCDVRCKSTTIDTARLPEMLTVTKDGMSGHQAKHLPRIRECNVVRILRFPQYSGISTIPIRSDPDFQIVAGKDANMKIRNRYANWLIAWIGVLLLRALFLTVRVDHRKVFDDGSPYAPPREAQRYCFCLWHDAIVAAVFSLKTYKLSGLISRHQDGTYLAHAVSLAGITPVRGSASRGGAQATRQLIDLPDLHVCITPDGPRGPRRVMKDGIIFLASRTNRPVVPTTLTATRYWSVPGGWSDMMIPKPFSRALLLAGTPIAVPPELTRDEISVLTEQIQKEMDRLDLIGQRIVRGDDSAEALLSQPGVYPDDSNATLATPIRTAA